MSILYGVFFCLVCAVDVDGGGETCVNGYVIMGRGVFIRGARILLIC